MFDTRVWRILALRRRLADSCQNAGMAGDTVVVVGQGYVGLPVAIRAVAAGYQVVGLDTDERRIARLRGGFSYVEDVSDTALQTALDTGRYRPTSSYADTAGFAV